ncbi:hypothetical protein FB547_112110 [Variovorax beijingensis]|uniref:Uncharacterized protein n=1 Tax=Variovorax beijingensis TaxID=2496117 RepID=A0A561BC48_9BURK|nr:hypothetical protein [Variovorax beijingensis]TWD76474.1 hypothetical protein FB547_112110 [Variovorax beijingensis]
MRCILTRCSAAPGLFQRCGNQLDHPLAEYRWREALVHEREVHVDYMLRNAQEYGDTHAFAIVFGAGGAVQTSISTDGGQFARLSAQYLARGSAALK